MRQAPVPTQLRGAAEPVPPPAPAPPAPSRFHRLRWWLVAGALVVVCAVFAAVVLWPDSDPPPTAEEVNGIVDEKVEAAITALEAQPPASVTVYEAIRVPLVAIRSEGGPGSAGQPGIGSGVVVNDRGDILTSLHVVEGSPRITVSFSDGTESPASVRSSDPEHNIAVLAPARLPEVVVPAVLGGGAQVGDETFALATPWAWWVRCRPGSSPASTVRSLSPTAGPSTA